MSAPPPPNGGYLPPPTYPQPAAHYGDPPGYPIGYPPPQPATNSLAIASLVCAFLFAPLGVLFGHMSLSQIKRTGEQGRGLALAGLVIGYVVILTTILVVIVGALLLVMLAKSLDEFDSARDRTGPGLEQAPSVHQPLPEFDPPQTLGSNCQYPATTEPGSKQVTPPQMGRTATTPSSIPAGIVTSRGDIGLTLDNEKAPCTVKNFISLAEQGFFDDTRCHRLTVGAELRVLQCGDPTATGTGGPGYRFPNEYPSNQYRLTDPRMTAPVVYPRGTLAMANSGPGTSGSQFYLMYEDSVLPPMYTAFDSIDADGLAVLEEIAADGVTGGARDGEPVADVTIESVQAG